MTRSANFFRSHSQARCFAPQGLDTADLASGRHLEHRARRSSAGAILDHPTPRAIRPRSASLGLLPSSWGGAGQNQGMKRTLLLALALAVIPVTVDAQVTELAQLRTLAEQGKARAQNDLGYMYATGAGVPEDAVLAYMWYNLAAAQGNERAQRNKDLLEERMTREQIAEGQRMSREWLEAHPPGGN